MKLNQRERKNYISIIDGTFRIAVEEGTEGAVKREYETSDKKTGVKWELVYNDITGTITDISFRDSNFGLQMEIELDNGEGVIQLGTDGNFAQDFMEKLPNIDLSKQVNLAPFSFIPDGTDKSKRGITIKQDDEKVQRYFFDSENKKNINGMPDPEGDTKKYDKDDWKAYFIKRKKFLVEYTKTNTKFPELTEEEAGKDF